MFDNRTETKPKKQKQDYAKTEEIDYIFHLDDDSTIHCWVGGVKIDMLIDSGSRCNIITDKAWKYLKENMVKVFSQVRKPDKTLLPYGNKKPLEILGSFEADIVINTNKIARKTMFYVVQDGTRNLLGKNTAIKLGVLQIGLRINAIQPFPKFKDVTIAIPINKSVKPVIQPYRRIPIPLENKVNAKLTELKDSDIIEEANGPTPWVSPMVPILKENGEVRICIDMRCANEAIIRENHPLPTMNKMLPNFRQAKYFSRLDIKNAFHQLEIDPDSRYITTFSTSKGLFRYKRLMFGISCAPEIFQKILEKILLGCKGTVNFIDDIIVYGHEEQVHDKRLHKVLNVLKENDILLNEGKCIYKTKRVEFLGHELSEEGVKPLGKYIKVIQTS